MMKTLTGPLSPALMRVLTNAMTGITGFAIYFRKSCRLFRSGPHPLDIFLCSLAPNVARCLLHFYVLLRARQTKSAQHS
jgi:hypothetical protein